MVHAFRALIIALSLPMIARKWTAWQWIISLVIWVPMISITGYSISRFIPSVPGFIGMKVSYEVDIAISRAEAINMAHAAFIQANGRSEAIVKWNAAKTQRERYELIKPYLAYAPDDFRDYMPGRYYVVLPENILPLEKVTLYEPVDY